MRTLLFKCAILVLFISPTALTAGGGQLKGKYTKEKTIKKEYDVDANALLKVKNSYGNITLNSINSLINYNATTIRTKYGITNVKV